MKYLVLIIDGASGWPVDELGGRTSLESAHTPHLDRLAREGTVGVAYTVPEGMEASSAVACMSLMGFDASRYYAGRGPVEAMAMGIELEPGQVAMRCNLVCVTDGILRSYSAGNITSPEANELIAALRSELADERLDLFPGVSFRHILTVKNGADVLATRYTAPHDLAGKPVAGSGPVGPAAGLIESLTERSKTIFSDHPVNRSRIARGLPAATQIWLFWPGMKPEDMPHFAATFGGRRAALSSGVDLLKGLALQAGIDFLKIEGVTDGSDNDYQGQMAAAVEALDQYDVVFVHVEAPDDAGHEGSAERKVRAIEDVDRLMVPQAFALAERWKSTEESGPLRLLVMPDHPTPLAIRTHARDPVPFVMWGEGFSPNGAQVYTESEARATGFAVAPGHLLMGRFLSDRC